jgi:hypothetical protein
MGFEDIFENKQKNHGNYREQNYPAGNRYSHDSPHSYHGQNDHQKWLDILEKIKGNKKLKLLVLGAAILILAIAIGLIAAFLPLIIKLVDYISQNGLQGLMNEITAFIDKLWKGSAK